MTSNSNQRAAIENILVKVQMQKTQNHKGATVGQVRAEAVDAMQSLITQTVAEKVAREVRAARIDELERYHNNERGELVWTEKEVKHRIEQLRNQEGEDK